MFADRHRRLPRRQQRPRLHRQAPSEVSGSPIDILSGKREAELSALGVISGFHKPDGIVGDLGGGSLELIDVHGRKLKSGVTLPLGGLALQDLSGEVARRRPRRSSRKRSAGCRSAQGLAAAATSIAVGGTWRSLTRLHMWQTGYPLHVMHGYVIPAADALEFSRLVRRVDPETLSQHRGRDRARRPLLAYAALVLENRASARQPRQVVVSALGVREGLLYSLLGTRNSEQDALIEAARELNICARARRATAKN